jgi:hypothetical protein
MAERPEEMNQTFQKIRTAADSTEAGQVADCPTVPGGCPSGSITMDEIKENTTDATWTRKPIIEWKDFYKHFQVINGRPIACLDRYTQNTRLNNPPPEVTIMPRML